MWNADSPFHFLSFLQHVLTQYLIVQLKHELFVRFYLLKWQTQIEQ